MLGEIDRRRSAGSRSGEPLQQRRYALALCAAFLVVAAAGAVFGRSAGPPPESLLPVAAIAWSLCDLLTAFLLFAQMYIGRRTLFGLIGSAYALSGLLTLSYILAQFANGPESRSLADQQLVPAFFLIWHGAFPVLVALAFLSASDGAKRFVAAIGSNVALWWAAIVIAAAVVISLAVYVGRSGLPIFVIDGVFQPAYSEFGISVVIVLNAAGCAAMCLRDRYSYGLSLWLTVSMFASFLECVLNQSSPGPGYYSWYAGKILTLVSASVVLAMMLGEIVRMYAQVSQLVRLRSHLAAARMRALWQISTSEGLSEGDHLQMILTLATANIRFSGDVFGFISHLDGGKITVDAVAQYGSAQALQSGASAYAVGQTFPLESDIHAEILAGGQTRFWNDPNLDRSLRCATAGWQGMIGTIVPGAGTSYFIIFGLAANMTDEPFQESDSAFVEVVASNVSHRFYQRAQLERFRYHIERDQLTGLYNRIPFQRLGVAALHDGSLFGIISIDLDQFCKVNEHAGNTTLGDELLVEVAASLRQVDGRDVVARLGGDDFGVLLLGCDEQRTLEERLSAYEQTFHRLLHSGDRGNQIYIDLSASLGAVRCERAGPAFDEMMACANVALDDAKQRGGGCGSLFGPELESILLVRSLERGELVAAMENDEFVLEYQPTFALDSRLIVGAEALIRWQHPTRGRLPPLSFLTSAKRENLMVELTTWVIERIGLDLETATFRPEFRCYFNVPAPVLESDTFLVHLEGILEAHPGLAAKLGLEITESEVMVQVERAIDSLNRLRALGLRVAVDDFGTGHSSLSYLKRLPIDVLKLDRSFINGLPDDASDTALATLFLSLAKQFSLVSVAEGIEEESQAAWLLRHGCMIGQGFLFSKPIAFEKLVALVAAQESRTPATVLA